ncbi:hypothetical protein ACTRXA_05250 [Nitrospina sp. P1_D6]
MPEQFGNRKPLALQARLSILVLAFFFTTGSNSFWSLDQVESYVKKKLRFNPDTLRIIAKPIDSGGISHLASMAEIQTVEKLVLHGVDPGIQGIRALGNSRHLSNLRHLNIEKSGVTDKALKELVDSPLFKQLKTLVLYRNNISDQGANILLAKLSESQLNELNLSFNQISDQGAAALTQSPFLLNFLDKLVMTGNQLGQSGKDSCAKFNFKINFRKLKENGELNNLESHFMGDLGLEALLETPFLTDLTELNLKNNNLSSQSAQLLAQSSSIKNIKIINLSHNKIDDVGAKALATSANLGKLKQLVLDYNMVGDEGAKILAQSNNLKNLEKLSLEENQIGPVGAKALYQSPYLKNLKFPIFGFH